MHTDESARRLGEAGFAVDVETYSARAADEPWLAAYAGLAAFAALLIHPAPLLATVFGIAALVLHARDSDGRPLFRSGSCDGVNVVARSPSAPAPSLVVTASWSRPRPRPRSVVVALHALVAATPAAGAAAWIAEAGTELPAWTAGLTVAGAALIVAAAALVYLPPFADEEGGTGAAVLTSLAPRLRDRPVWLVLLGRGGIRPLLAAHPTELAGCAWLNLEPFAEQTVFAVSEEGTWREHRADRWLLDSAEEAGAEVCAYRSVPTAVTPLLARRRRVLTLLAGEKVQTEEVALATALAALGPDGSVRASSR